MEDRSVAANAGISVDIAVIGVGFAGLYALYKFRDELGFSVQAFDEAGDVGGTWYWNSYPGCRVDTPALVYQCTFDRALLQTWKWSERYPRQPEVFKYLRTVADRHDLRRSINFNTRITKAEWDESRSLWKLTTDKGQRVDAQYVISAVGRLASTNYPKIAGVERFGGKIIHTSRWPTEGIDLKSKRVAVIGTGSTGTQLICEIAPEVEQLYVMQRTAQYVTPLGLKTPPDDRLLNLIKNDPDEFVNWNLGTGTLFGFMESSTPAMSVSAEQRKRVYQDVWNRGNGFNFMLETFSDIVTDRQANDTAASFIREKIRRIVNDPKVAEKLTPTQLYAKRPLATDGYYETFNRSNVTLVDLRSDPIQEITERGIRTASGEIALDIIIYATGFDAATGNYLKIETKGRNGISLREKWAKKPSCYAGLAVNGFPNLFMVMGPFGPFCSHPLANEFILDWIADLVTYAREDGRKTVEVDVGAEAGWVKVSEEDDKKFLFREVPSWITGANIPGKVVTSMYYMAGMGNYRTELNKIASNNYKGVIK